MEDCIEFKGCKDKAGYGRQKVSGKTYLAHRLAYCKAKNIDIKEIDGLIVMHTRDNPPCVNPEHLMLGTNRDNIDDRDFKNRQAKGEEHGQSKLNPEDVLRIIDAVKFKSQREVGKLFGINQSQVSRIVRGKRWAHLPEQPSID
jgi:hypothetical protein